MWFNRMKKAYLIIPLIASLALLIIPAIAVSSYQIISVTSDSMSPTIVPGDQLLVNSVDIGEIREGDIIGLDTHFHEASIQAQRVIEVSESGGKIQLHTQSDHDEHDSFVITQDSFIGLVEDVNPPILGLIQDAVRYPLIAIAAISAILLGKEFARKKSLEIEQLYCFRCENRWYPRIIDGKVKIPDTCPNKDCRSPYWRTPRKKNKEK